jgi:hypothetical protein
MDTIIHATEAVSRLCEFLKDKPKAIAYLTALCGPAQAIEDVLIQLLTERTVDTAIGAQLDTLGRIVGQDREGLGDDDFRRYIRARIATNRSSGLTNELLLISRLIVNDSDAAIRLTPSYPATVVIRVSSIEVTEDVASALVKFLRLAASGGVRVILEWSTETEAELFYWDTTDWDEGLVWSVATE